MKRIPFEISKAMVQTGFLHWIGILALMGSLSLGLVPLRGELADLLQQAEKLKTRLVQTQEFASQRLHFDRVFGERREELEKLEGRTLAVGEQAKLISQITQITRELGISILEMKPLAPEEISGGPVGEGMNPVGFHLDILSGYEAAGLFFKKLRGADLILKVEEFEMVGGDSNPGAQKTRLRLVAYELG